MRVEDAVKNNGGIWISLVALVVIYAAMGAAAIVVLLSMARRWRQTGDIDLRRRTRSSLAEGSAMSLVDVVAAMMFLGVVVYALFAGADFGSGVWDLLAGEGERARACAGRSTAASVQCGRPTTCGSSTCWCSCGQRSQPASARS